MKKLISGVIAGLFVMALCLTSNVFAEAEAKPKDTVVIDHFKKKKTPVTLNHKKHTEELKIKCAECHHTSKEADGKDAKKCSDAECHGGKVKDHKYKEAHGGIKKDDVMDYFSAKTNPFHAACVEDCHKPKAKEGKEGKKAPTKCKECHVGGEEEKE